jgi:hypothetical protein
MTPSCELWQVTVPYACYGIVVSRGKVIEAAPIANWMVGKSEQFVSGWIAMKKGKIVKMECEA